MKKYYYLNVKVINGPEYVICLYEYFKPDYFKNTIKYYVGIDLENYFDFNNFNNINNNIIKITNDIEITIKFRPEYDKEIKLNHYY